MTEPAEDVAGRMQSLADHEAAWLLEWCRTARSGRVSTRTDIFQRLRDLDEDRRKGVLCAMLALSAAKESDSEAGFFGHASPASHVFQALNRVTFRWSASEALWLAGVANNPSRTLGIALPTLYDVAAKALTSLDDDELRRAAALVHRLHRLADSWSSSDLDNIRAAAVQRLKHLIHRAGLRQADDLPWWAFDWRDTLGPSLKDSLAGRTSTSEVATTLELLSLRGNANTASRAWTDLIALDLPNIGLGISRTIAAAVLELPDDPDVVNHEGAPAFLGPESLVLLRAAVHVMLTRGDTSDRETLNALAFKCEQPVPDGWGHRRAAAVASDIRKALSAGRSGAV